MAYSQNFRSAARRHLRAGQVLHSQNEAGSQPGCRAVAGYLFGLAGELAVKEIMRDSGIRPLSAEERRDDPHFAHFPTLKNMLATAPGRRSEHLRRVAEDSRLFRNWDTAMRYAPTEEIKDTWVQEWKDSAEQLIDRMGEI